MEEVNADLEAIDVRNGIYAFYDSVGCSFRGVVDEGEFIELVRSDRPCDPKAVRVVVSRYFRAVGLERLGVTPEDLESRDVRSLLLDHLEWESSHGYR
jgi:hypothetical protein